MEAPSGTGRRPARELEEATSKYYYYSTTTVAHRSRLKRSARRAQHRQRPSKSFRYGPVRHYTTSMRMLMMNRSFQLQSVKPCGCSPCAFGLSDASPATITVYGFMQNAIRSVFLTWADTPLWRSQVQAEPHVCSRALWKIS